MAEQVPDGLAVLQGKLAFQLEHGVQAAAQVFRAAEAEQVWRLRSGIGHHIAMAALVGYIHHTGINNSIGLHAALRLRRRARQAQAAGGKRLQHPHFMSPRFLL
ncbi:hypothetical protein D3C72_1290080 [compost metagenome]